MKRADAVLNQVCSLTVNNPAYQDYVNAAHLLNSVLR
ncbi:hypothetical protein T01_10246 [Trichinella spiralis]|uniref:Uncharacterized protein n=1 Tax=Trichinella spiralis TaxID=6334 RepID=A0A0V0ZP20_TRISP|nr:hypothetical protein T01_3866 [Trichinella spiralis]KRY24724.1 hypothetical protein T01_5740 [Trichinella spiralis]KRY24764.1 hypothetical protein T01_16174 [Trichinella spiralis]KRY25065.1 hypothetical protein T01_10246 [Trichinella spiralis]